MAPNLEIYKRDWLRTELSSSEESTEKLEKAFLRANTSIDSDNTDDMWKAWLFAQGIAVSNTTDMWYTFMVSEGYSGNLVDMMKQYFIDNS